MISVLVKFIKFRSLFLIAIIFIGVTSCEETLEEETYSSFTADNFYTDTNSAELGIMGIYDALSNRNLYAQRYLLYFQSSDLQRHWRQGRGNDDDRLSNFDIEENNGIISSVWNAFYDGIYRANSAIDKVTLLRDFAQSSGQTTDLEIYNNLLGDAYFLRAFMYFQLVKNWGDVPLRLSPNISLDNVKIERTPSVEIYNQIESDMLLAISLLPEASSIKSPARINKGAAQGILARIYLQWAGNPINDTSKYSKAAEQAWAVVNSGQHSLNTIIEPTGIGAPYDFPFPKVYKNLAENVYDLSESMWEIHFSYPGLTTADAGYVGTWHGVVSHTRSSFSRGAPRWYALPTFFESFEANDTLRRDWSIARFQIDRNDNFIEPRDDLRWGVGKYRRYLMPTLSPNFNAEAMNWPIIRYADVLLILAESINETIEAGGTLPPGVSIQTAYESINKVRRRARKLDIDSPDSSVDLSGSGGDTFRQEIRNERAWELCFEGVRRYDLIRWGILVDALKKAGTDLEAAGYDASQNYFPAANVQEKHNLLPIPVLAEINQNPNILNTDPTNNGYR
ncbi:RagB/SusD family nutrient uptake outer membrane protein [Tamlana fucoidanivorans]|nr:RagB/SusD family nutrient uptake outer membrane protein [Tamlana fucoidanivorans]